MGRVRRGGYLIEWWMGDHLPKHVHVYRNGKLIAKVLVPGVVVLNGKISQKLKNILEELIAEGLI